MGWAGASRWQWRRQRVVDHPYGVRGYSETTSSCPHPDVYVRRMLQGIPHPAGPCFLQGRSLRKQELAVVWGLVTLGGKTHGTTPLPLLGPPPPTHLPLPPTPRAACLDLGCLKTQPHMLPRGCTGVAVRIRGGTVPLLRSVSPPPAACRWDVR